MKFNKFLTLSTTTAMLAMLGACGGESGSDAATVGVATGIANSRDALFELLPSSSSASSSSIQSKDFTTFGSLSSVWESTDHDMGGDAGTLKEMVEQYFDDDDDPNDSVYFSINRRVIGTLDLVCALSSLLDTDSEGLPTVGTQSITLDSDSVASVIDTCGGSPSDGSTAITVEFEISDVSGETGSQYQRLLHIDRQLGFLNDQDIYYGSNNGVINVAHHENECVDCDTPEDNRSVTFLTYNSNASTIAVEYGSYDNNDYLPMKENLRFYSDGTTVTFWGALASGFDGGASALTDISRVSFTATWLAENPTELAASISTDLATSGGTDTTDAHACISLSDYSVSDDDTLTCETSGTASSSSLTLFSAQVGQLDADWLDSLGVSSVTNFTDASDIYTAVPE